MIDLKGTVDHTFLGLKTLPWLLINFKIKSDLLSMIHTRPSEISTYSYFSLYLLSCVILRSWSTYFCSNHSCQLPSPISLQYIPFKFRAMNHWSYWFLCLQCPFQLALSPPMLATSSTAFILQPALLLKRSTTDVLRAHLSEESPHPIFYTDLCR